MAVMTVMAVTDVTDVTDVMDVMALSRAPGGGRGDPRRPRRPGAAAPRLLAALALATALAGCGTLNAAGDAPPASAEPTGVPAPVEVAGMCAPGFPDCVDMVVVDVGDEYPVEQERAAARALLGASESALPADARVSRRGAEQMMLTEDYVLGRKTVALDADAAGGLVVTEVTVELPGGPETFFSS